MRFIAATHDSDPADATHRLIRQEVKRGAPFVLVEGVPASLGETPSAVISDADRLLKEGRIPEPLFASLLAARRGLRVAGGDLSTAELIAHSRAAGYRSSDILGAHALRRLAGDTETPPVRIVERLRRYLPDVDADFRFEAWFQAAYRTVFSPEMMRHGLGSPCGDGVAAKIIRSETDARNRHLYGLIVGRLDEVPDQLVVFGANHLIALHALLKQRLPQVRISTSIG